MKVLSIDLDYIMGPTIDLYQDDIRHTDDTTPEISWTEFNRTNNSVNHDLSIDQSNLLDCYQIFLRSLKHNPTVVFGYEHDAILYQIGNLENIDLVNIDHHDDVMHGGTCGADKMGLSNEVLCIKYLDHVCEGNWGAWLDIKNKLNSFTWISNSNSGNLDRSDFNEDLLGEKYRVCLISDYDFGDYDYDHVFICLSPSYTAKNQWHYFKMFMIAYKEITGNEINIISEGRYEYHQMYRQVTNEILY